MIETNGSNDSRNAGYSPEVWKPDPIEREVPADAYSAITQAILTTEGSHRQRLFIRDGLIDYLRSIEEPHLGLATTSELLRELTVRAEIHGYGDYRTVDNG